MAPRNPLQRVRLTASTFLGLAFAASASFAGPGEKDKAVKQDPLPAGALVRLAVKEAREGETRGAVAFAADGMSLAVAGGNQTLLILDTASGKMRAGASDSGGTALAYLPKDKALLWGNWYGQLQRWDLGSDAPRILAETAAAINSLAVSPDGRTVVLATDQHDLHVLDADSGEQVRLLKGHDAYVTAVAFLRDGKTVLSGGQDRTLRLWDVTDGKLLHTFQGHADQVSAVAVSPDGKTIASGSWDGTVRLWEGKVGGKEVHCLPGHGVDVQGVAFSADGASLASVGLDGTLRLWDVASGKERFHVEAYKAGVVAVAFSIEGKMLATRCESGVVRLWDPANGKPIRTLNSSAVMLRTSSPAVWSVAFSPDGHRLVTGHADKTVRQWDAKTGEEIRILGRHPQTVWGVAYSPDGKMVASCARRQGVVRLWDAQTGKLLRVCHGPRGGISRVVFSHDGKYLAASGGSFDPTNFLWDPATGRELQRFSGHEDYVDAIALTPDAKHLVSADRDGVIRIWQTATGKELARFQGHPAGTVALSVAPDGRTFASGGSGDGVVRLWDLTGRTLREFPLPGHGASALAFSPDGKTLAMATHDTMIRLLERASGQDRLHYSGHQGIMHSLSFSGDGRRLASASADGTTLVWDVTGLHPLALKPTGMLSAQELERHWRHLASDQTALAGRSLWTLVVYPGQSVPWLQAHLKPQPAVDPKRIAPLLAKLDAKEFAIRDKAMRELEALGDQAESDLTALLKRNPSLEVRRRVERLLSKLEGLSGERLRAWRALEVLEHIGSPEARIVLQTMAGGAPAARLTQEAEAALERLARRKPDTK